MCIRDRLYLEHVGKIIMVLEGRNQDLVGALHEQMATASTCLLYTSDAADERSSVDLGGRRIIKKKNMKELIGHRTFKINT